MEKGLLLSVLSSKYMSEFDREPVWVRKHLRDVSLPRDDVFGHRDYEIRIDRPQIGQRRAEIFLRHRDETDWTPITELDPDFDEVGDDPRVLVDEMTGAVDEEDYADPVKRMLAFELSDFYFSDLLGTEIDDIDHLESDVLSFSQAHDIFDQYLSSSETREDDWYDLHDWCRQLSKRGLDEGETHMFSSDNYGRIGLFEEVFDYVRQKGLSSE